METIMSWVQNGLLFTIFASVVIMLCPNKTYIKYISLVIGLLFILIMISPLTKLLHMDTDNYIAYLERVFWVENVETSLLPKSLEFYEKSLSLQATAVLKESGYDVKEISVNLLDNMEIDQVQIVFGNEVGDVELLESNLNHLFGEEVSVQYEYE